MDHSSAQDWLDRYLAAWKSYDADEIGALFSDDIAYRYHPSDEPVVGREAVVASWLDESESGDASTHDEPGTYARATRRSRSTVTSSSRPGRPATARPPADRSSGSTTIAS